METSAAAFYYRPRMMAELDMPHEVLYKKCFEIVKQIKLSHMDFDNFTTDMLVEREFLEKYAPLCDSQSCPLKVLLITTTGQDKSVLAIPNLAGFVEYAAVFEI